MATEGYQPTHEEIAERAYLLWLKRGQGHGHDVEIWLEAERLLRSLPATESLPLSPSPQQKTSRQEKTSRVGEPDKRAATSVSPPPATVPKIPAFSAPPPAQITEVPPVVPPTAPAKPPSTYEVILIDPGENPVRMVRELRGITGLDLKRVKALLQAPPQTVAKGLSQDEADALRRVLQQAGGTVELRLQGSS